MHSKLQRAEFSAGLLHLSRSWRRRVDEAVAEFGLSDSTAWALVQIRRNGQGARQGAVAEALGIEGPSVVRLLDQLCEAGLVERRGDRADRRAKTVHLTEAGAALAARIEEVLDDLRPLLLAGVSDSDLEACLRVFRTVGRTVGWTFPGTTPAPGETV
jgi:MarR family transcriptional regulator for hemolysin